MGRRTERLFSMTIAFRDSYSYLARSIVSYSSTECFAR